MNELHAVTLSNKSLHDKSLYESQNVTAWLLRLPPQDAVLLARMLRDDGSSRAALAAGCSSSSSSGSLAALLREFEQQRIQRCLPLTVRSWAFGFALQLPYPPVSG